MKKSLSIVLVTVLIVSLFVGCDKNKKVAKVESNVELTPEYENSSELLGDSTATGELKISYYYPEYSGQNDQLQLAVEKFKKLYPKVLVTVDRPKSYTFEQYNDYNNNMESLLGGSSCPDVAFLGNANINKLVQNNLLFDLTEFLESDPIPNMDELNTSIMYGSQVSEKQSFIPLGYTMPLLISSEAIQKEQNFDITTCDNYSSCADLITQIIDKGKTSHTQLTGFISSPSTFPWLSDIDFTKPEQLHDALNDATTRKEFERYKTSFYPFRTMGEGAFQVLNDNFAKNLNDKKTYVGEMSGIDDFIGVYKFIELTTNPIVAPWRTADGAAQAYWYNGVGISNKSKNKENAYNFIKVLLSKEIQLISEMGSGLNYFSISNAATKEYFKQQFITKEMLGNKEDKKDSRINFINEVMEFVSQAQVSNIPRNYRKLIDKAMIPYFDGKKSYEECVKDAEKAIQAYLIG